MPMVVDDMTYGSTVRREFIHMTGGLRAARTEEGWLIEPLPSQNGLNPCGPVRDEQIGSVCAKLGVLVFGADEISEIERLLPARIWTPLLGVPKPDYQPADIWAWIARSARLAEDSSSAGIAENISISLRAAGIRLRDASDEYHRQLAAALERGQKPGLRFQNIPMMDLHLAFHSLLAELGSARDYLATFAARRIGAPKGTDALNRLIKWLEESGGNSSKSDPVVIALLDGWKTSGNDPWLFDLGEYRNLFLHRQPISADQYARWLMIKQHTNGAVASNLLQLLVPARPKSTVICDALTRFVDLHAKMCRLAYFVSTFSAHAAKPIQVEVKRE